jgi:hypothetical protein
MPIETWVFLLHTASTGMMVGIIWFVQLVHYPLFARAGADGFGWYAAAHARWTTWVVAPPMLVELVTSFLLLGWRPVVVPLLVVWGGIALTLLLWGSTIFVQVPLHTALAQGWHPPTHRRLVRSNWFRTLLWTVRGVLVLWLLTLVLQTAIT